MQVIGKHNTLLLAFSGFTASSAVVEDFIALSVSSDLDPVVVLSLDDEMLDTPLMPPPRFSGVYRDLVDMFC